MDHEELRHCVYCRRAKFTDMVGMQKTIAQEDSPSKYYVRCAICSASGPRRDSAEEAKFVWNRNTEIVADVEHSVGTLRALVLLSEQWKDHVQKALKFIEGEAEWSKPLEHVAKTLRGED